jgi:amino acid transporter
MLLAIGAAFLTYLIPVTAVWYTGLPSESWGGGGWVAIAGGLGGPAFSGAMLLTTMVSMFGAFNSLTLSSSRLPMVLAQDGYVPRLLARKLADGTPWVSLVVCGVAWIAALGLSFDRLVLLDILTYGVALILEFVALIVLRITEPHLARPFRLPGGIPTAVVAALGPTILLIAAAVKSDGEKLGPFNALHVGIVIIAFGAVVYWIANRVGASKPA